MHPRLNFIPGPVLNILHTFTYAGRKYQVGTIILPIIALMAPVYSLFFTSSMIPGISRWNNALWPLSTLFNKLPYACKAIPIFEPIWLYFGPETAKNRRIFGWPWGLSGYARYIAHAGSAIPALRQPKVRTKCAHSGTILQPPQDEGSSYLTASGSYAALPSSQCPCVFIPTLIWREGGTKDTILQLWQPIP